MNGLCKQLLVPTDCKKNAILSKMATFVLALRVPERLGSMCPRTHRTGKKINMLLLLLIQKASVILMLLY